MSPITKEEDEEEEEQYTGTQKKNKYHQTYWPLRGCLRSTTLSNLKEETQDRKENIEKKT